ncbi:HNH endonuclease signature motif containing protein [Streptomyces sp. NPDC001616]|uniref:HNH endonuclease n=1 Tax=Streptomyces sp. NPDC001616 TaxID=3156648 RepID=UPI0033249E16
MAPRRRRTSPTDTVRTLVHVRDGGRCVRCNSSSNLTIHHRVNRGMGGAREEWINEPQNLLLVCTTCNGWFEDHPRESYSHGWKVRRPMLPGEMVVRYPGGTDYALHPDGSRSRVTPEPAATESAQRFDGTTICVTGGAR